MINFALQTTPAAPWPADEHRETDRPAIALLMPDLPSAQELLPWLKQIDHNRWYSNFGPLLQTFESRLTTFLQSRQTSPVHLTTVSTGTAALELALATLNLPPGSRVLLPAYTFPATAAAVVKNGLQAVFADVDEHNWSLTADIATAALNHCSFDAVLPVAAFGYPQDASAWDAFHRKTGLPIVVDAASAFSSQKIGCHGIYAFSLHATKSFGIGEGGLLACADKTIVERVRRLSNFGFEDGVIHQAGQNAKLSEYHAAVGLAQLERWPLIVKKNRKLAAQYRRHLQQDKNIVIQGGSGNATVSTLPIRLNPPTHVIAEHLREHGIETRRWYSPALDRHPAFAGAECIAQDGGRELTITRMLEQHVLGLPYHHYLSKQDIKKICNCLHNALQQHSRK